jgi:putative FmdB family regulatory protein
MPLYEYSCERCGDRVEVLQKPDDPPPVCQPCDETMPDETPFMTRKISLSSFRLKGKGWASDGYEG